MPAYASELVLLANIPILLLLHINALLVVSLTVGSANRMGSVINAFKDITSPPTIYAFLVVSLTVVTAYQMGHIILACPFIFSWFLQILVFNNALKDITTTSPHNYVFLVHLIA